MKIARDDTVEIMCGDDRGKRGRVLQVLPEQGLVLIEGINFIKRHTRPTRMDRRGGIVEREAPVAISNVMVVCNQCGSRVKVRRKRMDVKGPRVRECKKCGEIIGRAG